MNSNNSSNGSGFSKNGKKSVDKSSLFRLVKPLANEDLSAREKVFYALGRLDALSTVVLNRLYGFTAGRPAKHEQTARELGASEEQIRDVEAEALRELMGYRKTRQSSSTGTSG